MANYNHTQKSHHANIRRRLLSIIILSVFLLIIVLLVRQHHSAFVAEADGRSRRYISIQIEEGDSLWSIASEHKSESTDIIHYINSIREINHLKSDDIYAAQYLIIPVE